MDSIDCLTINEKNYSVFDQRESDSYEESPKISFKDFEPSTQIDMFPVSEFNTSRTCNFQHVLSNNKIELLDTFIKYKMNQIHHYFNPSVNKSFENYNNSKNPML